MPALIPTSLQLQQASPGVPKQAEAKEEETFEGIDLDTYKKFWKK